jgi:hypothetical protein
MVFLCRKKKFINYVEILYKKKSLTSTVKLNSFQLPQLEFVFFLFYTATLAMI